MPAVTAAVGERRRPLSLNRQVVVFLLLPVILLMAGFTAVLLVRQSRSSLEEQQQAAMDQARERAFGFGLMLKTATQPTARTAQLATQLPDLPTPEYWRWFRGLLNDSPALYGTGVTFWPANRGGRRKDLYGLRGKDGNFHDDRYAYQDESFTYDGADGTHEWFDVPHRTGKPAWSRPYFDEGSGNVWMVTYSVPFNLAGKPVFNGVAFSDIRIDTLRQQLETSGNFQDGEFVVLNAAGEFVYHPDTALLGKPASAWTPLRGQAAWLTSPITEHEKPLHLDWPGLGPAWVARHTVPEVGMVIISAQRDGSVAFGLAAEDFAESVGLLLALLLMIAVALYLSSRLTDSVARMTTAAEAVARGDWNIKLPETGADELARLARSLNDMAHQLSAREDTLREQQEALAAFNRELEARVEERTRELSAARREADRANAAKSRFLANVSHELRTPMNAIIGFSTLARDLPMPGKPRDYFLKIGQAGDTLRGLIDDLLDFSRIEAGGLRLEQTPFRLVQVLDQVIALHGEAIRQKGLRLRVTLDPQTPKWLLGDPLRLTQVLSNLLGNAAKFTEQGELHLLIAPMPSEAGQVRLQFTVRDTGIGIAPEVLPRLFQAFSQADASTTRRYGGTGLGLAICRELIGLMGGEIEVQSVPGQGSCFCFDARFGSVRDDAASTGATPLTAPPAGLRGRTVLLAEDIEINREIAREMLERAGMEVTLACDGQEALDWLTRRTFDLLIFDLQMPVMDGLTLVRQLRASPRWASLPVVAMTANAMPEDHARCLAAGMNGHVAKPVQAGLLYAELLRHLAPA